MADDKSVKMEVLDVKECVAKSSPVIKTVLKIFLGMLTRKAKNTKNEWDDKVVAFFQMLIS